MEKSQVNEKIREKPNPLEIFHNLDDLKDGYDN
jgi:hypothetical protein